MEPQYLDLMRVVGIIELASTHRQPPISRGSTRLCQGVPGMEPGVYPGALQLHGRQ